MKSITLVCLLSFGFLFWGYINLACAQEPTPFEYVSPRPGAELVRPETTIAVRHGEIMDEASISGQRFTVAGSKSGVHQGRVILADDQKTVIFKPDIPFTLGETVTVTLDRGLKTTTGKVLGGMLFEFAIMPEASPPLYMGPSTLPLITPTHRLPQYLTAPSDFPAITVTVSTNDTAEGYIFLGNFKWMAAVREAQPYLLILDNAGEPVYYQRMPAGAHDFKKQPNGLLTFFNQEIGGFQVMDSSYEVVDTYWAGHGYGTDNHELLIISDTNHALLMIYDPQRIDMGKIVPGGVPTATVVGLVVQELDSSKNVIFEWRSWDHFSITDTRLADLTAARIDYVHGNAIDIDHDGHLLISSRHTDEVTKINRQTGDVIWRLGGRRNEFTFTNDNKFWLQHNIRRLPNGHITLFDNNCRSHEDMGIARAVEYQLDENKHTISRVWEYSHTLGTPSIAMGNAQRLPNGNTLIGWGTGYPSVTEVEPDGDRIFELTFAEPDVSYRAFRFPWEGVPTWPPTLAIKTESQTTTLFFSWNGATNVASYQIYGGKTLRPAALIGAQRKTGFETGFDITDWVDKYCYFRVMPLDKKGQPTQYSNVVFAATSVCNSGRDQLEFVKGDTFKQRLRIVNPSNRPYVYAYIWNNDQTQTYLLDDASRQGRQYDLEWFISPQQTQYKGPYQQHLSSIVTLHPDRPLAVAVAFSDAPDRATQAIYERRFQFNLTPDNQIEVILPAEEWHIPNWSDQMGWQLVDIDQVMTDR
jgi:hypothetical protein